MKYRPRKTGCHNGVKLGRYFQRCALTQANEIREICPYVWQEEDTFSSLERVLTCGEYPLYFSEVFFVARFHTNLGVFAIFRACGHGECACTNMSNVLQQEVFHVFDLCQEIFMALPLVSCDHVLVALLIHAIHSCHCKQMTLPVRYNSPRSQDRPSVPCLYILKGIQKQAYMCNPYCMYSTMSMVSQMEYRKTDWQMV